MSPYSDAAQKSEPQQNQLSPSYPVPSSSQTAIYKESSDSTDEASEEFPDEEETITAKRKTKMKDIQEKSLYDPWAISSEEINRTGFALQTPEKGQQKYHAGPRASTPISEPTVEWQKRAKSVDNHYPETYQSPTGSDILTELQMRHTSSVSRIPRRINSIGAPGDLSRTEESRTPNDLTFNQDHVHGSQRIPAGFSTESPIGEESPDTMKQDNVAGSPYDAKQANQASEFRDQRTASPAGDSQTPREHSHLEFTGETWKAAEEPEHNNLNVSGQGLITVSTEVSPMNEKALDVSKSKKSLATHYKGAPTYKIPESSDKGKMRISNITQIPKSDRTSRESETMTTKKPESSASESGPQGLPSAKTSEDQQAFNTLEKLNLSPTSRIPRLKIALETAGETPKVPVEDLKPLSRQLAGKNGTTEVTDQAKAAFQPTSRIAKYQSSSSDDEREKGHKQGAMFTINALGNRHLEEEALTDPKHFKSLRHFWEKGIESNKANSELPSNVSKIPFRRLRSPDYKSCPTEVKQSTTPESKSNLVTREVPSTNSYPKSELQGNRSVPEEGEAVQLTWTSKLPPVPAPRARPTVKIGKSDSRMTKWDQHAETTPSMVDEVSKINVPQAHSDDSQTKDTIAVESIEHGRPTTLMHSINSSLDESSSIRKSSQTPVDCIVEEPIKKEILPAKEIERKEMYEKIKKMGLESAKDDTPSKEEHTMRKDDDKVSNENPILLHSDHKSELRTPADNYTIRLDEESQVCPKERDEEIILWSSQSDLPTLEQDVSPGKNYCTNIPLKSQAETLVEKSPEDDPVEPQTILQYNKHLLPRSVNEESTWLDTKAHSGDAKVRTSSTDELHYSVNLNPVTVKKPITIASTDVSEADLMGKALNSNSSAREEESSNIVHCVDDSEGPIYGLSPVMKALARAKKNNAKSMDNLNCTVDRETIGSSVNENEVKRDADNKPPAVNIPTLEHSRVKELSKSVPMLMTESESDSASEVSFNIGWHRKTPSDASHSSDMASVSSVSGSIMSVYSGDFGSIDAQGSVQFALDYNEKNKEFQIYVYQCKDLAVVDEKKGRTDAYVKTYLLPDKARMGKRKTSVKRRNVNPLYNEILKYKIEKSVLLIQKLNLSVWHNDTLGRNSFLGEVDVDLASWDWSNRELNWYLLKSRCPMVGVGVDHRGEINLAIKYVPPGSLGAGDPPTGEVHIWMKNAKDLPQLRSSGVDSFVKCYVLPDTSKKSYQKTRIVKKDTNPIYNHTIVYDGFRTEDLKEACVELTVWDHEKLTNHFLGGLRLGFGTGYSYGIPVEWMDSTEEETALWQEMVSNPNEWIPGSLLLRSQLGGKKLK
ncbi:synaptotagmin-like protein 2 isoform X2 [Stegostoma tigrinum]|uniref:synaptotagmin-like protein 2 isoform X2 n=1 Tax=Stegostoma tigrinum TaxID=3053191 RepID=UPI00287056C7|nr:synaptotagmin-like protein 2 isoform X2 [Stegostoma tigrinum]